MRRPPRQSLLVRLLGVYLLFIIAVLGMGFAVNQVMQRQLRADVQAADVALGQAIARDVDAKLQNARKSLESLSQLDEVRQGDAAAMGPVFRAFKAARPDLDRVYWLDAAGIMRVSVPVNVRTLDTNFSQRRLFQHASQAEELIIEAGIVDLTTYHAVAAIARPVREQGQLRGVLATNLLLDDFSSSLQAIVDEQAHQGKPLLISLVDAQGILVASPEQERLLQPVLDELPGAAEALAGRIAGQMAPGPRGQEWLFSAVPVPSSGWAVVVQRPAADVLATATTFNTYLMIVAILFAAGVLLFWFDLLRLVIRPLQQLAAAYRALPQAGDPAAGRVASLAGRADEVGGLARALERLKRDVTSQLRELRTLLDTSKVVVETLDPHRVAEAIIHEVRRLVDVQAAAVLVLEESGQLRVLASQGRSPDYGEAIRLRPRDAISPAAQALREDRPVQLVAGGDLVFPPVSYAEGFRALLALPIRSPHADGVVLVVHRTAPEPFEDHDVGLLMTFANYAALAWEHAVLYERSDVRLREEQQTLAAIMRSMSDGLVLAGVDGTVLYINPGAAALAGCAPGTIEGAPIDQIHAALRGRAAQPAGYDHDRARAEAGDIPAWLLEIGDGNSLFLAAVGGLLATIFMALCALVAYRSWFPARGAVKYLALYPRAFPGTVIGLGFLWALLSVPQLGGLRNTLWILVIAYSMRYLPLGFSSISPSILQISDELDRAARVSGANWLGVLRHILLPLLRPALIATYLLLFITFLKEYSVALFLNAPGSEVIGTTMIQVSEQGGMGPVAALAVIQLLIIAVVMGISRLLPSVKVRE